MNVATDIRGSDRQGVAAPVFRPCVAGDGQCQGLQAPPSSSSSSEGNQRGWERQESAGEEVDEEQGREHLVGGEVFLSHLKKESCDIQSTRRK